MIRVECECGKAARVPARYAGRQVKCSGCGGKLTIPSGDEPGGSDSGSGGAVGGPVGGPVGSAIGGGSRRPSSGQIPRRSRSRQGSGQEPRPRSGARDRGGDPDYGAPKRRRSSDAAHDPYAPPQADVDEQTYRRGPRGGREAKRDLQAEAHIVAIGIWQRISGVLMIALGGIFGIAMMAGAFAGPGRNKGGMIIAVLLFGAIFIGISVLYYMIGVSLMKYANWARIAMVVLFVLGVLRVVVTIDVCGAITTIGYGGAQLWALYGERGGRVFSPGYQRATRNDRRPVPWAQSPFFWLPFVLIALSVVLVVFAVVMGGLR